MKCRSADRNDSLANTRKIKCGRCRPRVCTQTVDAGHGNTRKAAVTFLSRRTSRPENGWRPLSRRPELENVCGNFFPKRPEAARQRKHVVSCRVSKTRPSSKVENNRKVRNAYRPKIRIDLQRFRRATIRRNVIVLAIVFDNGKRRDITSSSCSAMNSSHGPQLQLT